VSHGSSNILLFGWGVAIYSTLVGLERRLYDDFCLVVCVSQEMTEQLTRGREGRLGYDVMWELASQDPIRVPANQPPRLQFHPYPLSGGSRQGDVIQWGLRGGALLSDTPIMIGLLRLTSSPTLHITQLLENRHTKGPMDTPWLYSTEMKRPILEAFTLYWQA